MNDCPDTDTLVSLGTVTRWELEETLRHLLECEVCLERIRGLEPIGEALSAEEAVGEGVVEGIMASIQEEARGEVRVLSKAESEKWGLPEMVSVALAGCTGLSILALSAMSDPGTAFNSLTATLALAGGMGMGAVALRFDLPAPSADRE